MKKRIIFVISTLGAGGAEKSLVNLLNLMDRSKYSVDLLLFKQEGTFFGQIPDWVHVLDTPKDLYYLFQFPAWQELHDPHVLSGTVKRFLGSALKKTIYRRKPFLGMQIRWDRFYKKGLKPLGGHYDIAISFMDGEAMYYVAEKIQATRKIAWVHNDYCAMMLDPRAEKKYLEHFDKIATISNDCAEIFLQFYPDYSDRLTVLPNLTSSQTVRKLADSFEPVEYRSCKQNNVPILVSVGRLHKQKGFDIAIKITAYMKKKSENFCWFIIGDGEQREKLLKDIEAYGVPDCIKLLGLRENPYPYIKNADIVVQPSRYEGKSVALDEAKILCKPILVSNYPTVGDQITDGVDGIVAELRTDFFAEKLMALLHSPEQRMKLAQYLEGVENGNASQICQYDELFAAW